VAFAIFWLPLDEIFTINVDYEEDYSEKSYEKRESIENDQPIIDDTKEKSDSESDSDSETT